MSSDGYNCNNIIILPVKVLTQLAIHYSGTSLLLLDIPLEEL